VGIEGGSECGGRECGGRSECGGKEGVWRKGELYFGNLDHHDYTVSVPIE